VYRPLLVALAIAGCIGAGAPQEPAVSGVRGPSADIDRLFARWNSTRTPGFAVGVIRDGQLVFSRGYGMANLEYGVALGPRSAFYIASMSKQFTAACALLLVERGQLDLDAPVRRYLPELRVAGTAARPLRVRHLLNHTGGVREWSSLTLFAGQDDRFEQRIGNRDVQRLLLRQDALEFEPGTQYRYSSGGYQLLTLIIERASGQPLPRFAERELFAPLGMRDTIVDDNYAAVRPRRVESYRSLGDGRYERILKHFDLYGDGGVVTTLEDLARWDAAFDDDRIGAPGVAAQMVRNATLDDGTPLRYAGGLEVYTYKGHRIVEHGGGMLGFTVDMMRFPDQHLTVIALANVFEEWSTAMAFRVADLFLPQPPKVTDPSGPTARRIPMDPSALRSYAGYYWSAASNYYRRVRLEADRLVLDEGEGTTASPLVPVGFHRFVLADRPSGEIVFTPRPAGGMVMSSGTPRTGDGFVAERYDSTPPASLAELRPLLGDYRSDELAATYRLWEHDGQVFFAINDNAPLRVFPQAEGRARWNAKHMLWIGFGEVIFRRDARSRVTGLTIGDQRVSGIRLRKVA